MNSGTINDQVLAVSLSILIQLLLRGPWSQVENAS
jgi:hypothetical protein